MGICISCSASNISEKTSDRGDDNVVLIDECLHTNRKFTGLVSLYSQQGSKQSNQDAAVIYQGFGKDGGVFCGVFDGHGLNGDVVSRTVRNRLPGLILSQQKAFIDEEYGENYEGEEPVNEWRRSCVSAFKVMDKELKLQENLDCSCSGSTAVTIVIQGEDMIVANLGDSRAILGTVSLEGVLTEVQLTTDLKPNLLEEAARIKRCNGAIYSLNDEPSTQRVWVPNEAYPGLAMSRAFGDLDLKNYGVIAIPQMSYHRLTRRDQFIVLATDGIWDVLSNNQVATIVRSVKSTEAAAQAVVDAAAVAWKQKYHFSKVDDCTAVCLFFQERMQDNHRSPRDN